jgi:hypothetical protein
LLAVVGVVAAVIMAAAVVPLVIEPVGVVAVPVVKRGTRVIIVVYHRLLLLLGLLVVLRIRRVLVGAGFVVDDGLGARTAVIVGASRHSGAYYGEEQSACQGVEKISHLRGVKGLKF